MRPKFRSPEEVASSQQTERFSILIPKSHLNQLRLEARAKKIPVGALINEAIRAYCEYLATVKGESKS